MSSTPLNKNKVKQKPVESCEKQEIPQAFRGRVTQKQKKTQTLDTWKQNASKVRHKNVGCSLPPCKELSPDKNSLLRIINEGQLCSVFV